MTEPSGFRRRVRRNGRLFWRFGLVGASGVVVNLATLVVLRRLGPDFDGAVLALGFGGFHVRWYHVYSTIAFLVASLWNFQLNRSWAFRSRGAAPWWREYVPFLIVASVSQAVGLVLLTLLMHPHSPIALPHDVLDSSTGFRTRLYWAQLIVILAVTPLSYALHRVWTFRAVRSGPPGVPNAQ